MSEDFPLPDGLPVPKDDGAADHLQRMTMCDVSLPATNDTTVNLQELPTRTVLYVYPLTGRPDKDVIPEGWEDVPGARGCTPESRGFQSRYEELRDEGVRRVFGLSTRSQLSTNERHVTVCTSPSRCSAMPSGSLQTNLTCRRSPSRATSI